MAARPDSDAYRAYLHRVAQIPPTTPEELAELDEVFRAAYAEGASPAAIAAGARARTRLVEAYQPLAMRMIRKIQTLRRHEPLEAVQEANFGLLRAAEKYRPDHGAKFATYATYWIWAHLVLSIKRAAGSGALRTRKGREVFPMIAQATRELVAAGVDPSAQAISEHLGIDDTSVVSDVIMAVYGRREVSMDTPRAGGRGREAGGGDDGGVVGDLLADAGPSPEEIAEVRSRLGVVLCAAEALAARLSPRDADVLWRRVVVDEPETLAEIGETYGISRERVRQLENRLRARLLASLKHVTLEDRAA